MPTLPTHVPLCRPAPRGHPTSRPPHAHTPQCSALAREGEAKDWTKGTAHRVGGLDGDDGDEHAPTPDGIVIADMSRYPDRKRSPAADSSFVGGGGAVGGDGLAELAAFTPPSELAALAARLRSEKAADAGGSPSASVAGAGARSTTEAPLTQMKPSPSVGRVAYQPLPSGSLEAGPPADDPGFSAAVADPSVAAALAATEEARARLRGLLSRLAADCRTAGVSAEAAVATVRGIVEKALGAVTGAVSGEEAARVCRIRPANATLQRLTGTSPVVPVLLRAIGWRPSAATGTEAAGTWMTLDARKADVGLLWLAVEEMRRAD